MSKTHTATMLAWVYNSSVSNMAIHLSGENAVEAIHACSFYLTPDDTEKRRASWSKDYLLVGRADITLILDEPAKVADAQITSLRAKKASVLAEAQNEATNIERQIQTLLAIANEVQA